MSSYSRVAYSPLGSATQVATIKIGKGDWEITQLSVILGGTTSAMNGVEHAFGTVAFETLADDGTTAKQKHYLVSGRCLRTHPLVMVGMKRIAGPGRIKSSLEHGQSSEHTLAVTYRRVRD